MHPAEGTPEDRATTSTSRSLLARVRTNDAAAWRRLITLYTPLVWHWCRKMDLPGQEMADVFQEVFQSVAAHIRDFHRDRPGDTFRGWLRTITRNKVHDHFRAHKREPQAAGGSEAKAWWSRLPDSGARGETLEGDERYDFLFRQALELIKAEFQERTWRAFWLVVVEGQSPQVVAQELDMSPGAVRVAKSRVLHRLRLELGDCHP
ncbi:MAG TPA: sigma-70 family RNA polymerase sigma factor [Gemmataceae bacterium]|jgi:RNA polymerase sigma-70 factor (ECF subfamily)|nr:sigma-70 family RNA polymerase sigma factor [Gemmataceae bacterium]